MNTKFNFLLIVLLMAFSISVTSCDDDLDPNTFEGASAKYVGQTYQLTDVHWSGNPVDLDGDGIRRWDLMEGEMSHLKGFDPYSHNGVVQIHRSQSNRKPTSSLDFLVSLPFPVYTQMDGKWKVAYMMYLSVSPEMVFHNDGHWTSATYQIYNHSNNSFVGKIDNLVVTDMKPDSFNIRMVCCLINEKNELEENVLVYHYQR